MRLLTDKDADRLDIKQQYATSGLASFFWFVVFLLIVFGSMATFAWHYMFEGLSAWWAFASFWFVFWFGLFAKLAWSNYSASRMSTNWVVRTSNFGVAVRFRSYLNHNYSHNDADHIALWLDWRELLSVRHVIEKSTKGLGRSSSSTQKLHHIELCLGIDADELKAIAETLKIERKRMFSSQDASNVTAGKSAKLTGPASRGKFGDYPVVLQGDRLRIRWNGVKPGLALAMQELSKQMKTQQTEHQETNSYSLKDSEIDDLILRRLTEGDELEVVRLLKIHRSMSTTEAKVFIDSLKA